MRHHLDAQSVVWALDQGRDEIVNPSEPGDLDGEDIPPLLPLTLADLASNLNLDIDFLKEIQTLLDDKKQVIFQGPPGTGKTYVARELAKHLAGADNRVTLVQFHPSYSYEDFVQGYRPNLVNGQAGFKLSERTVWCALANKAAEQDKRQQALPYHRRD